MSKGYLLTEVGHTDMPRHISWMLSTISRQKIKIKVIIYFFFFKKREEALDSFSQWIEHRSA